MYLNVSPFGRNNHGQNIAGVQEAAMGIFGKNASDLNFATGCLYCWATTKSDHL